MTSTNTFTVVVPAAGIGKRMGSQIPKQYLTIAGKTVLEHTLLNLLDHPLIKQIIVVLHPEDQWFQQLSLATLPAIVTVTGGNERADSVLAGLNVVDAGESWVLVHDAARPCLHHDDLSALLALTQSGNTGGILATAVRDTMKRTDAAQHIVRTESRDNLWHALTPQLFPLDQLKQALQWASQQALLVTDEASAIEQFGGQVKVVEGRASNLKITQPDDLLLASFYLTHSQPLLRRTT